MQDDPVKTVVHLKKGTLIKGLMTDETGRLSESLQENKDHFLPSKITLRVNPSGSKVIDLDQVKAVFFVKTLEGNPEYNEVKFFHSSPLMEGIWARVRFSDSESMEGVIHNSLSFLINPGFFLKPPDPQSNNRMIYVVKKSLVDFQILGIRTQY